MDMNNALTIVSNIELKLCFSGIIAGHDEKCGCVGRLDADFGFDGEGFYRTWIDYSPALKTPVFKYEFDTVIDSLHANGILKNLSAMTDYCHKHPDAGIDSIDGNSYAFKLTTASHIFYLRCKPSLTTVKVGDNLNCFVYNRKRLEAYLPESKEKPPSILCGIRDKAALLKQKGYEDVTI